MIRRCLALLGSLTPVLSTAVPALAHDDGSVCMLLQTNLHLTHDPVQAEPRPDKSVAALSAAQGSAAVRTGQAGLDLGIIPDGIDASMVPVLNELFKPLLGTDVKGPWSSTKAAYVYICCFLAYVALCIIYEAWHVLSTRAAKRALEKKQKQQDVIKEASPPGQAVLLGVQPECPEQKPPGKAKVRVIEWDVARLVLSYCVVHMHYGVFLNCNPDIESVIGGINFPGVNGMLFACVSQTQRLIFITDVKTFDMCGFAFISGVFGTKIDIESLCRVLCYTIGTAYMWLLLANTVLLVTPDTPYWAHSGRDHWSWRTLGPAWYLFALAAWRWTISPLFHVARARGFPTQVLFATLLVVSYVLWEATGNGTYPAPNIIPYQYFAFGPFFALGQMLPAATWTKLLQDKRLSLVALATAVAWYSCLIGSAGFRRWNFVVPWEDPVIFHLENRGHWPVLPLSLSCGTHELPQCSPSRLVQQLVMHLLAFVLKATITLAVIWVAAALARPLHWLLGECLWDVVAGCGSRTFYNYVLHVIFGWYVGARMGIPLLLAMLPEPMWYLAIIVMAMVSMFAFSCSLSERLFSWVVMPSWLMDVPLWIVRRAKDRWLAVQ